MSAPSSYGVEAYGASSACSDESYRLIAGPIGNGIITDSTNDNGNRARLPRCGHKGAFIHTVAQQKRIVPREAKHIFLQTPCHPYIGRRLMLTMKELWWNVNDTMKSINNIAGYTVCPDNGQQRNSNSPQYKKAPSVQSLSGIKDKNGYPTAQAALDSSIIWWTNNHAILLQTHDSKYCGAQCCLR